MAVILPSVYKDGTATVAANGVAVTGQGTMWLNTVLPGDFFGTHKSAPNRILAVNSNTSLTLAYPWIGGAQAAAAYEIMYQSDNARMQETARQLLEKLSSGNLDAFAGLSGSANKLPIFTGPGTIGTLDTGAKGRLLVASATTVSTIAMLGPIFGGAAPEPGSADVGMTNGDFDTVIYPGIYTIGGSWVNGPSGAASSVYVGVLEVYGRSTNNFFVQKYRTRDNSGITYKRISLGTGGVGGWGDWYVIESATVGTVRQLGNFPSGSIIERGSNANGEYVRLADGTQIAVRTGVTFTRANATEMSFSWTYPIAFAITPNGNFCLDASGASVTNTTYRDAGCCRHSGGVVVAVYIITNPTGGTAYPVGAEYLNVRLTAVGRWF